MSTPIQQIRKSLDEQMGLWLKAQLKAHKWAISAAAKTVGLSANGLRHLVNKYPALARKCSKHGPGRGRPRKSAA
jgi:hypothetical protein